MYDNVQETKTQSCNNNHPEHFFKNDELSSEIYKEVDAETIQLIEGYKAGDLESGWKLFYKHKKLLIDLTYQSLGYDECSDLIHDIGIYLVENENLMSYDPTKGKFKTWLSIVALRRKSNYFRRINDIERFIKNNMHLIELINNEDPLTYLESMETKRTQKNRALKAAEHMLFKVRPIHHVFAFAINRLLIPADTKKNSMRILSRKRYNRSSFLFISNLIFERYPYFQNYREEFMSSLDWKVGDDRNWPSKSDKKSFGTSLLGKKIGETSIDDYVENKANKNNNTIDQWSSRFNKRLIPILFEQDPELFGKIKVEVTTTRGGRCHTADGIAHGKFIFADQGAGLKIVFCPQDGFCVKAVYVNDKNRGPLGEIIMNDLEKNQKVHCEFVRRVGAGVTAQTSYEFMDIDVGEQNNCRVIDKMLLDYVCDALRFEDESFVSAHILTCKNCYEKMKALNESRKIVDSLNPETLDALFAPERSRYQKQSVNVLPLKVEKKENFLNQMRIENFKQGQTDKIFISYQSRLFGEGYEKLIEALNKRVKMRVDDSIPRILMDEEEISYNAIHPVLLSRCKEKKNCWSNRYVDYPMIEESFRIIKDIYRQKRPKRFFGEFILINKFILKDEPAFDLCVESDIELSTYSDLRLKFRKILHDLNRDNRRNGFPGDVVHRTKTDWVLIYAYYVSKVGKNFFKRKWLELSDWGLYASHEYIIHKFVRASFGLFDKEFQNEKYINLKNELEFLLDNLKNEGKRYLKWTNNSFKNALGWNKGRGIDQITFESYKNLFLESSNYKDQIRELLEKQYHSDYKEVVLGSETEFLLKLLKSKLNKLPNLHRRDAMIGFTQPRINKRFQKRENVEIPILDHLLKDLILLKDEIESLIIRSTEMTDKSGMGVRRSEGFGMFELLNIQKEKHERLYRPGFQNHLSFWLLWQGEPADVNLTIEPEEGDDPGGENKPN